MTIAFVKHWKVAAIAVLIKFHIFKEYTNQKTNLWDLLHF